MTETVLAINPEVYVDRKRYAWLLSVFYPLFPVYAIGLHAWTGIEWLLLTPVLLAYGAVPVLDWLLGEDQSNPPEMAVPALEADRYYRVLTWITVPLHVIALVAAAWYAASAALSWGGWLALVYVTGLASGIAVNTAHEMGHKRDWID